MSGENIEYERIPLSVPNLCGNELRYVTEAVETEWVSTAGPFVQRFEQALADYVGVERAVACQSGTAGIHLALMEAGVKRGDLVLVPTVTFVAAVNPVTYIGAEPVFLDCDDSLCIDPLKLEDYLSTQCVMTESGLTEKQSGKRIAALVVVHVFGNLADMPVFVELCERYRIALIEDATEALGTWYSSGPLAGRHAGTFGDFGVFSFNGNKIITTGGGGMIVGKNAAALQHIHKLSIQAKNGESDHFYDHDEIGFNYRLTNLQAALGVAQMESLPCFRQIKKSNYERYIERGLPLLDYRPGTDPNYWLYALQTGGRTKQLMQALAQRNIETRPIWKLIHTLKPYLGSRAWKIERANRYYEDILNIPCSTNLREDQLERVADSILELMRG